MLDELVMTDIKVGRTSFDPIYFNLRFHIDVLNRDIFHRRIPFVSLILDPRELNTRLEYRLAAKEVSIE